jgi:hypothetical protein
MILYSRNVQTYYSLKHDIKRNQCRTRPKRTKKMQWTREGAHHVLYIRAMMASEEWESKRQGAVLPALGAVA